VKTAAPTVSVVIPVYRSEGTLADLTTQLVAELPKVAAEFEIIFVNDGSPDRSWALLQELAARHPCVRAVELMRNYGQHNALLAGIRAARHELIVTMDDDLQHPPREIARLLDRLAEGVDVVYGVPAHERHGFWRDVASQVTKLVLQHAMGADIARRISAFRVFRTPLRAAFASYSGSFVSIDVLLTWATTRFAAVEVDHQPRTVGQSNYTLRKLITHALNMMTGFSTLPLQLASVIGFAFTLFGLAVLAYVLARFIINGGSVPGFPFLASIIAVFSGAQLFALGIIGEYLARAHFRLMDKPSYAIRHQLGGVATGESRDERLHHS
jgi:undecaprenyl-phosphate 4-deoxy-4-formamido-L-arabinose transferase